MGADAGLPRAAETIGREAELARLRGAVDAAAAGRSAALLLIGEGGIGKTRLLAQTQAVARERGLATLSARAAVTTPLPFGLVSEALRSWQRHRLVPPSPSPYDSGLRLVLPEWPQTGSRHDLSDAQLRLLAFEGVVVAVREIALDGGAVVVLDDLHAADPESIEAARYLASAVAPGVAVLLAMRPGENPQADELARALRGDGATGVLDLGPLAPTSVAELLTALTSGTPPPALVDDIVAHTDGVPLLVEEVLAAHLRAGSVAVADGVMEWRGEAAAVPSTLQEMVGARLDRLEAGQSDLIRAAAVLGDFAPEILTEMSGRTEVDDAVAAGERVGLVDASGPVSFRHAIIRDAVLASLGVQARSELHRRAARALGRLASEDADTVERRAYHHDAIGEANEAAALFTQAARARLRTHALLGAEQLARTALARALDAVHRVAAADALAAALVAQGRWTEALDTDEATTAAYGATPERRQRMAQAALEVGRPELARRLIGQALVAGDESPGLQVLDGRAALVLGDGAHALACADRVIEAGAADIDVHLTALDLRGRAYDFLGRREDAESTWTTLARRAAAHDRTQAQLRAYVQLGKVELFSGRPVRRLREAVELAQSAGAFVELAWAEENLSIGLVLHGELDEAEQLLDESIARCRRQRLDQVAYLLTARAMVEAFRGRDPEPWLDEAESMLPTADLRLHTLGGRADIALREGRYDDAIRLTQESWQIMTTMPGVVPMDAPCWLVWALAAAGRPAEARVMLDRVRSMPDLGRWQARPLLVDAAAALLDGDFDAVDALVYSAYDWLWTWDVGLMRLVGAAVATGATRVRWLREALQVYDDLGVAPTARRVRGLLRSEGAAVPRRRRADAELPEGLSERGVTLREADVLRLVTEGLSNAEIAERLVLSVRTVEAHVSSLLTKLGVSRRTQLVAQRRPADVSEG